MFVRIICLMLAGLLIATPAAAATKKKKNSWSSNNYAKTYKYKKNKKKYAKRYGKKKYKSSKYKSYKYKKYKSYKQYKKYAKKSSKKKKYNPKFPPGAAKWPGGPKPHISGNAPRVVKFRGRYKVGSVVIDSARRKLYYVLPGRKAYAYPIAVGKRGFGWTGVKKITRKAKWPAWRPPAQMRRRKPHLPKFMAGGIYNPLGARALYLGGSLYRIHGTYDKASIGQAASSGCFRMFNQHVVHLSKIAKIGTTVYVRKSLPKYVASK